MPDPVRARFDDFELDEANARLVRSGRPVEIPPRAFAVLCALLRRPDQLLTKDVLLDEVWGHRHVSESVLKTLVSQLRRALGDDAQHPRFIETAARRGYRFVGRLAAAGASPGAPIPAAAPSSPPSPAQPAALIGRARPLATLQAAWAGAARGQRQVLFLAGEPGIGKTTLVDHFAAARFPLVGAMGLGQCVEHHGAGEPYMPLLEALQALARADGEWVALMRRVAPSWLAQMPWHLDDDDRLRLPREVAGATQDRMLRELGELLDRAGAAQPLLLVLEDLHWSDAATAQAIAYLARRRTAAALMVVGTFRPADLIATDHPLAGLRQELLVHRLCRELNLEAFAEADVGALVAGRLDGADVPEDFARALHDHSGGLPLFAADVLDELIAGGALRRDARGWTFPEPQALGVPAALATMVERRLARLAPPLRRLLVVASVAGVEFTHAVLAAALDEEPAALLDPLDALCGHEAWLRAGQAATLPDGRGVTTYRFRHALYRHAVYGAIEAGTRLHWHRRVADALRAVHGAEAEAYAAERALHDERGGEPASAAREGVTVAGRALARGEARAALAAARHALRLGPATPAVELELRVVEGVAASRLQVITEPEVTVAFDRAAALAADAPPGPVRARALHAHWWIAFARGELAEAGRRARLMQERAGDDPLLRVASGSALGLTAALSGEFASARRHLEDVVAALATPDTALPFGSFVHDPGVEARGYLALVHWWCGDAAAARRLADAAIDRAAALRHPISLLVALNLAAALHYFADEWRPALAMTERVFEVIEEYGLSRAPGSFAWLHGHLVAALGRAEDGLAEIRRAEASCRALGLLVGLTGCKLHLAEACRDAGLPDEALQAADDGLALAEASGERFLVSPLLRVRAGLLAARGDAAGAAAARAAALATARAQGASFHAARAEAAAA